MPHRFHRQSVRIRSHGRLDAILSLRLSSNALTASRRSLTLRHSQSFRPAPTAWALFAPNPNGKTVAATCSRQQRLSFFAAWAPPPIGKPLRCGNRPCPHPRSSLGHRRLIVLPTLLIIVPLNSHPTLSPCSAPRPPCATRRNLAQP